jgi:hypothetical protein
LFKQENPLHIVLSNWWNPLLFIIYHVHIVRQVQCFAIFDLVQVELLRLTDNQYRNFPTINAIQE